ncbi:MAG: PLP-dependent transferase [Candidatus Latescibacteria bacterium]|nr:PLP-dependent transferase [Candidatus Latescibacterota bacterium]
MCSTIWSSAHLLPAWGGVRTTTQIPASKAFLDIPEEQRLQMGITNGLIRVSAGLEDSEDLKADFDRARSMI